MRALLLIFLTLLGFQATGGCASYSVEAQHKTFKRLMSLNIGSSIDKPAVAGSAESKHLIGFNHLPNGNVENEYRGRGTCRVFFEFNPDARIIVAWRFEGSEQDCTVVP